MGGILRKKWAFDIPQIILRLVAYYVHAVEHLAKDDSFGRSSARLVSCMQVPLHSVDRQWRIREL